MVKIKQESCIYEWPGTPKCTIDDLCLPPTNDRRLSLACLCTKQVFRTYHTVGAQRRFINFNGRNLRSAYWKIVATGKRRTNHILWKKNSLRIHLYHRVPRTQMMHLNSIAFSENWFTYNLLGSPCTVQGKAHPSCNSLVADAVLVLFFFCFPPHSLRMRSFWKHLGAFDERPKPSSYLPGQTPGPRTPLPWAWPRGNDS